MILNEDIIFHQCVLFAAMKFIIQSLMFFNDPTVEVSYGYRHDKSIIGSYLLI